MVNDESKNLQIVSAQLFVPSIFTGVYCFLGGGKNIISKRKPFQHPNSPCQSAIYPFLKTRDGDVHQKC